MSKVTLFLGLLLTHNFPLQVLAARGCVSDCINDRGGMTNYVNYQVNDDGEACPWKLCTYSGQNYEDFSHPNYDAIDNYGSVAKSQGALVDDRSSAWEEAYNQHFSPMLNGTQPRLQCGPLCLAIVGGLFTIIERCVSAEHCFCSVCPVCGGCKHINGSWYNTTVLAIQQGSESIVV